MQSIPISLITLYHPDTFFCMTIESLKSLPSIRKDRIKEENAKGSIAEDNHIKTTIETFHDRSIRNFGTAFSRFRNTWMDGSQITAVLADYSLRLIYTAETGTQAKYKFEARPNWGSEPNVLPKERVSLMLRTLQDDKVSVRQCWLNPLTRNLQGTPQSIFYEYACTLNVVIGPYVQEDNGRRASLRFVKYPQHIAIHQHQPSYTSFSNNIALCMLPACPLWMAEY